MNVGGQENLNERELAAEIGVLVVDLLVEEPQTGLLQLLHQLQRGLARVLSLVEALHVQLHQQLPHPRQRGGLSAEEARLHTDRERNEELRLTSGSSAIRSPPRPSSPRPRSCG